MADVTVSFSKLPRRIYYDPSSPFIVLVQKILHYYVLGQKFSGHYCSCQGSRKCSCALAPRVLHEQEHHLSLHTKLGYSCLLHPLQPVSLIDFKCTFMENFPSES